MVTVSEASPLGFFTEIQEALVANSASWSVKPLTLATTRTFLDEFKLIVRSGRLDEDKAMEAKKARIFELEPRRFNFFSYKDFFLREFLQSTIERNCFGLYLGVKY